MLSSTAPSPNKHEEQNHVATAPSPNKHEEQNHAAVTLTASITRCTLAAAAVDTGRTVQ
jgi:hypothetical protein